MSDVLMNMITSYYNEVPYDSNPYPLSAIEQLEALAWLFGVNAPELANARVLELGCASGGNLTPMGARHPQAMMLGVDLSPVQVQQGQDWIAQVRVPNVEIRQFSIADIDESFGEFDYIVCHGVYSWVPPDVQQAILQVCSRNLAGNGIAYVSYNVYPGWKSREIVRDAMRLRGGARGLPQEKLSYARGILEFLEQSARAESVLKKALDEVMPLIRNSGESYLLHEFLEPCNSPCYFTEFIARAQAQGLSYLCDARLTTMFVQNYAKQVSEPLLRECGDNQVLMEQYLDFLADRTFRQTLLVKEAQTPNISYRLEEERLRMMHYAGAFTAVDGAELMLDTGDQVVTTVGNTRITLRTLLHKVMARELNAAFPATLSLDFLVAAVTTRLGQPSALVKPLVLDMLKELLITEGVRVRCAPVAMASGVSQMPQALLSVRRDPGLPLMGDSITSVSVCNQWHELMPLTGLERCVIPLLDGMHTVAQIAEYLGNEARAGRLRLIKDSDPITDDAQWKPFIAEQVSLALEDLHRKGLLIA